MAATFAVRCDDYERGPIRSRDEAERLLAQIEKLGACQLPHEVIECPTSSASQK